MRLIASILFGGGLLVSVGPAHGQSTCRVLDPTGTPLNVRTSPSGRIVGALRHGMIVTVLDRSTDRQGRSWVYVGREDSTPVGWVYDNYIDCRSGMALPAAAERGDGGYAGAVRDWQGFNIDQRIKIQVLLTAAGFSDAVPNVDFTHQLYQSIRAFQIANGLPSNGLLNKPEIDRLLQLTEPIFAYWGFNIVQHPFRGRAIWAPLGLGLSARQDDKGLVFEDPQRRLRLIYRWLPLQLKYTYENVISDSVRAGSQIDYKVLRDDFFVVARSSGNDRAYTRYHRDGNGILGFTLWWNDRDPKLFGDRISTLMSASLRAAMTGAPFTAPMNPSEPRGVVSAPAEPKVHSNAEGANPPQVKKEGGQGTGFFVTGDGLIVTNSHVVDSCTSITAVSEKGGTSSADIVARDLTNDLALLKTRSAPSNVAAIRMGPRVGEPVAAFGFPLSGLLATSGNFTLGNVTALSGLGDDTRYLQIQAPVQPGNSGGPLLDYNGNVIGVVSGKLNAMKVAEINRDMPQNVNFAIKAGTLINFLDSNRVAYKTDPATRQMQPADLADHARSISVKITCLVR